MVLHYHFAKFQLNSLSLRAISPISPTTTTTTGPHPPPPHFSMDRKESANIAISSAMACLHMVLDEPDIRDAIVGVPIFTHTMVTFSAVFLLKVAVTWNSAYLSIDGRQVRRLVERVIELMGRVSAGERHLTRHIARGLSKMLERFNAWEGSSSSSSSSGGGGGGGAAGGIGGAGTGSGPEGSMNGRDVPGGANADRKSVV